MPGEDLMRTLLGEGADTPSSALAFVANDNPEDEKIAKDVMRNTSGAMGIVNKWRQEAKEATRYYNGDQWPDLDRMRMEHSPSRAGLQRDSVQGGCGFRHRADEPLRSAICLALG